MSQIKRLLEMEEQRNQYAAGLLVKTKVAEPCWAHGELVRRKDSIADACRLGNHLLKHDAETRELFSTPRELTDTIKFVFEDSVYDECPRGDVRH